MASESKTAVVAALVGNAALVMLEGAIAATTGSAAMLAETFHSLADTGNQMLLFVGMRLAGAFVFEAMSLGVALHSVAGERRGVPRLRFMRETRDPTLPTVLLEDSAALLSILVAAAGLGLARGDRGAALGRRGVGRHRPDPHRGGLVPGVRELLAPARGAGDRGS